MVFGQDCGQRLPQQPGDLPVLQAGGVEEEVEAGELARAIDRWLDGLDRPDRTAFLRRYWYGQRVDQVARQAGCAPNTMTKRLGRLRDSLRRALEQEGISV